MEIILTENISKRDTNVENRVNLSLESKERLLPIDSLSETIDQYDRYTKEKDNSHKYRFIFTVNPICTNVLFNPISEIVYKEGSNSAIFFGIVDSSVSGIPNIRDYMKYKGYTSASLQKLSRDKLISDTSYSHNDVGGVVYHCGYDIFSNHILRGREFGLVSKINEADISLGNKFNELSDYTRDAFGKTVKEPKIVIKKKDGKNYISSAETKNIHTYIYDTTDTFRKSVDNNLSEMDGWYGFQNPCRMNIPNYVSGKTCNISLNKCMNNNKAGEFIDMYPDRSLFSFIPKYNKYRNRIEPNWDFCLTYPCRNYYDNDLIQTSVNGETINGIKCTIVSKLYNFDDPDMYTKYINDENDTILIQSNIKHNLVVGSTVMMSFIADGVVYATDVPIKIVNTGVDGTDTDYYFSISYTDIADYVESIPNHHADIELRVRKVVNGKECKYYMRIFKKIPNFSYTNVYNDNYLTEDEIEQNCNRGFNMSVNKMAFERSIYNDNKAQIIYNDDVDLKCLRDNLGRELSQIYLTVIKRNKGYKKWYPKNSTDTVHPTDASIEFNHCFGVVTSGFDLPEYVDDYNVHKIHNIGVLNGHVDNRLTKLLHITESYKNLENNENVQEDGVNYRMGITLDGDEYIKDITGKVGEFFGDIVEFSEYNFNETTLEDVYFRFNTAQRECEAFEYKSDSVVDGEFANLHYTEIKSDDYDINGSSFETETKNYNEIRNINMNGTVTSIDAYPANIFPEGYCYKAHYPITVRELDDNVQQGSHTRMDYELKCDSGTTDHVIIKTVKNYYIEVGDTVYLYKKDSTHNTITGKVTSVSGDNYELIEFDMQKPNDGISNYSIYKKNPLKPDFAYEMNDGTGRYLWRDVKKEINLTPDDELFNSMFANGAHYFHKNINFFLKRQDPHGNYGLLYGNGTPTKVLNMTIGGLTKDIKKHEYIEEETMTC